MNFRDMGPFENPLVTHGNIGFNTSGPPGLCCYHLRLSLIWAFLQDVVLRFLVQAAGSTCEVTLVFIFVIGLHF